MNEQELGLLLTVARILRAVRSDIGGPYVRDDLWALDEALKPWSADPSVIQLHHDLQGASPLEEIVKYLREKP